jgi:hypothetical protein
MKCPPLGSGINAWSSPDGATYRWLDHESSDFINSSIHWWIHNLMDSWEEMEMLGCRAWFKECVLSLPLLSLSASYSRWGELLCPPYATSHDVQLHLSPIIMEPANWNLWNDELKLIFPPSVDKTPGISHGDKSLTNMVGDCLFGFGHQNWKRDML